MQKSYSVSTFLFCLVLSSVLSSALNCSYFECVVDPATSKTFKLSATAFIIKVYVYICFKVYSIFKFLLLLEYSLELCYDVLFLKFGPHNWFNLIVCKEEYKNYAFYSTQNAHSIFELFLCQYMFILLSQLL